jgi:hypothetical protein
MHVELLSFVADHTTRHPHAFFPLRREDRRPLVRLELDVNGQTNTLTTSRPVESQKPARQRSPVRLAGEITGIVSALATVVGLLFVLAPSLKPEPPPLRKEAFFREIEVERNVTRAQYLQRIDSGPGSYAPKQLREAGVLVRFNVVMTGHKGDELPLRWALYDARSGGQIHKDKATTLSPEADTDQASWQVWTPLPQKRGKYYVLLQLFEEDGLVPINHAQTQAFAGVAPPQ